MTLVQACNQTLAEMDQTIRKLTEALTRMEHSWHDLKDAMILPVPIGVSPDEYVNEGPHYPGLG